MPKIGPFKALDFKIPTQKTEDLYIASVDKTVQDYTRLLHETSAGDLQLTNTDFETGRGDMPGEYGLTDSTYQDELAKLRALPNPPPAIQPVARNNPKTSQPDAD